MTLTEIEQQRQLVRSLIAMDMALFELTGEPPTFETAVAEAKTFERMLDEYAHSVKLEE